MTQQQLAENTGIKCDALSRIERNAIQPSFSIDHKARQDPLGVKSGKLGRQGLGQITRRSPSSLLLGPEFPRRLFSKLGE